MAQTLIRNATVVTMDPALGDIEGGDVLVRDEKIPPPPRTVGTARITARKFPEAR